MRLRLSHADSKKRNSLLQRMFVLHIILFIAILVIITRLLELQIFKGEQYHEAAVSQHFGGVRLPARRGEIQALSSKTNETSILATNTTLDLVYVDPLITDDPAKVSDMLAEVLLTEEFHTLCSLGQERCPRELVSFYEPAFDPILPIQRIQSGVLLERISASVPPLKPQELGLPDFPEARRLFARDIERRIAEKRLTYVPLKYGATKLQMKRVEELGIPGVHINWSQNLIFANPEDVPQARLPAYARSLAPVLELDPVVLRESLQSRPLRYVPIMRGLPPALSDALRERKRFSYKETLVRKSEASTRQAAEKILDPLRSVALIPEHWRFYPDGTVASHVVGFLNNNQEAQYGIERTFDPQLRGQEGLIQSVSDTQGGQILTNEQTIIDPKDGDTVILTIDRTVQKEVERVLADSVEKYDADSGQVIIIEPKTGRILAMANAPLFDSNAYGHVYAKEPIVLSKEQEEQIVVEIYHPQTNVRVVKAYIRDVFGEGARARLSEKTQKLLAEIEELYDLEDQARYFFYLGEHNRHEIFPTQVKGIWLKYRNNIGVGAYINRAVQEIYEPGSVMKPVTMAIALDQGEVTPEDIYDDVGPVKVDEFTIRNALRHYGKVTMTNCLEFSINTCMTSVSAKLGKKLFFRALERFGFGRITGIELEDELPGELLPWRKWSRALLATAAYGQGVSATPLQMVRAFAALANDGKLMKPMIIDRVVNSDGTIDVHTSEVMDQVITPEASETIIAMLVSSVTNGYAKPAKVPGYRIAGKTGTSQIAGPGGKYEAGTGAFIASFVGFAPPQDPRFVMLIKLDRPRKVQHGAASAAPMFREIATFLFKYYGIPPDDE